MVAVRRVLFRDWVKERDNAAPNRWHINTGTLIVNSNTLLIKKLLGTGSAVAPAEATTVCGTIPQAGEIYFDVQMNLANFADPYEPTMCFVMFGNASTGIYLGNSYVLAIDSGHSYLYRSDANSLTLLDSESVSHTENVVYKFIVHCTPSTGAWSVTEAEVGDPQVETLTATDNTYTTGSYIGIYGAYVWGEWSKIRVRCPNISSISRISVTNGMTKEAAEAHVFFANEDSSSTDFTPGDGLEIVFGPDATEVVDFWGKIEKIHNCLEDTDEIVAFDWRVELLKAEMSFTGMGSVSQIIEASLASKGRVLTTGGVKDTADPDNVWRSATGEGLMAGMKSLCQEAGYFMSYDGTKELLVTDTPVASGVTLVAADIAKAERVEDLIDEVNTAQMYYNGGAAAGGGSGTNYENYGRSEKVLADMSCPNSTQATARNAYFTGRYGGDVAVYDIWCFNGGINPGETGTITMPYYGITAATFLCLEKSYDIPDGLGFRYRMNITIAGVKERHGFSYKDRLTTIAEKSQRGLATSV